jgi:hypothetical protein
MHFSRRLPPPEALKTKLVWQEKFHVCGLEMDVFGASNGSRKLRFPRELHDRCIRRAFFPSHLAWSRDVEAAAENISCKTGHSSPSISGASSSSRKRNGS